ncbi:MAG: NADH-quinone oxidoreductase subunit L, partial [Microthrixaceae bacterium]|nr:NADH-quinone oxidoreductase subunit L [Microthrixaceae bacterium]
LPTLGFVLILLFGKKLLGPTRAHWIGIPLVGVAFVLALLTAGAWISHSSHDEAVTAETEGFAYVDQRCSDVSGEVADHGEEALAVHEAEGSSEGGHAFGRSKPAVAAAGAEEGGEAESMSQPVVRCVNWWQNGDHQFSIGTIIDGQSVLMLVVVTLISLLVHIYSAAYVKGDRRFTHYYAFLSLFTASMLFFVLAENMLQMIVGWELVGLCSFALIGHWWEDKDNSDAALKAFLTNRVGDMGLMIGVIILFFAAGQSWDIIDVNTRANTGQIGHTALLVAACCLIAAVMSKSGQFILHTWLPDAMAGPTPVSALIHAATMVVAGIYMVARLYPVFFHGLQIGGSSINLLAVVGAVTGLFGALLAFVQKDIKKVLAYSTVSQLGFMVTALGVGAWTAALFHLFTHAFFKACLFLGAGSLSHAAGHSFNMVDDMGGLRKKMPVTFWTYVVATGALAGIFPLAGFWSKDEILAGTGGANDANGTYYFALVMLLLAAFCTAAYMTRTIWYAFFNGEFKGDTHGHGDPHENGPLITVPLIILGTLGAVAGFANLPGTMFGVHLPESIALRFEHIVEPVGAFFPGHAAGFTHAEFNGGLALGSLLVGGAGIAIAYLYYWKGALSPLQGLAERNRFARVGKTILENKYYLDWLYTDVIVGFVKKPLAASANWFNKNVLDGIVDGAGAGAVRAGRFVYDQIDQAVVDGAVNGTAVVATETGGGLAKTQTGRVQQYATLFFAAAAIMAGVLVLVVS